jgi:hypothetical protein
LPITSLNATSIASSSGTWTNLTAGALQTIDASRASSTTGSVATVEITNAPSDYGTVNDITLYINWRISATVSSRLRSIKVDLLLGGSLLSTFTTPDQGTGATDRTDSATFSGLNLSKGQIDALQIRLTLQEGSGMATTTNHQIDRIWADLNYELYVDTQIEISVPITGTNNFIGPLSIEHGSEMGGPGPRYFAEIGEDNVVLRVLVCDDINWLTENLGGTWEETFKTHENIKYCGKGHGFDPIWPERFAQQWIQPTSAEDSYAEGTLVFHNGRIWISTTPANVWEPGVSAWHDSPSVGYPMWVQPTGAHDAYALGARVQHNNKIWESTIAANVWEPGTGSLWIEVLE